MHGLGAGIGSARTRNIHLPRRLAPGVSRIHDPHMRLDDEAKAFHYAVYLAVAHIPHGNVTTYGHIAYLIGKPQNSRLVGSSLKHAEYIVSVLNAEGAEIGDFPWWRVISSSGLIAKRDSGEYEQKRRLVLEGVQVVGMKIAFDDYGWFPDEIDL